MSLVVRKGPDSALVGGKRPPHLPSPPSPSPRPSPPPHLPPPFNRPPWRGLVPESWQEELAGVSQGSCMPAFLACLGKPPSGSAWECPEDTPSPLTGFLIQLFHSLPAGSGGHLGISACPPCASSSVRFQGQFRSVLHVTVCVLPPGSSDPWRWPRPAAAPLPDPPARQQESAFCLSGFTSSGHSV